MVPTLINMSKRQRTPKEKSRIRFFLFVLEIIFLFLLFFIFLFLSPPTCLLFWQVARHKSKKGGVKKRVYFWGGICWWSKTPGVAWTASDNKVLFRHTKNLCHGTVFEEEDDDGNPCVYRIVETRAAGDDDYVSYVSHFAYPDADPPENVWLCSTFEIGRAHV